MLATHTVRLDDEVWRVLQERARTLGLVFSPPNETIRAILGLSPGSKRAAEVRDGAPNLSCIHVASLHSNLAATIVVRIIRDLEHSAITDSFPQAFEMLKEFRKDLLNSVEEEIQQLAAQGALR